MSAALSKHLADTLPPTTALTLGGLVVLGLVLWLVGRKLARPACAVSGLVLGGLAGLFVGQRFLEQGAYTLPLVLGGAIVGGLLAALLFRVWMGVSAAVLLALAGPAVSIIWQGTPPPPIELAPGKQQSSPHNDQGSRPRPAPHTVFQNDRRTTGDRTSRQQTTTSTASTASSKNARSSGPLAGILKSARGRFERQTKAIGKWWNNLSGAARWGLIVAALIGAGVGLLLGLILPYTAAAVESALVGAVLIFYCGRELLTTYFPDHTGWLPDTPRLVLLTLGLMTVLGVGLQWTLFRRRREK